MSVTASPSQHRMSTTSRSSSLSDAKATAQRLSRRVRDLGAVVSVAIDQAELQPALTFVGAAVVGEDVSSNAEQPQPDPRVGELVASTPRNREDLRGDVVGLSARVRSTTSESPQVVEVGVEQATEEVIV